MAKSKRSKGHRVVKRSLKTTDFKVAEKYVKFLSQIIDDNKLWKILPKDTPELIRQIWLGSVADFQVTTENGQVSLSWSKDASQYEVDVPSDFVPVDEPWEPKGNPAGVREKYVDNARGFDIGRRAIASSG